jgi:hypothetical protein
MRTGRLRRDPDAQLFVVIPVADADVGLHISRRRASQFERAFDHHVRFGEAADDVTALHRYRIDDQVVGALVNARRARRERLLHGDGCGELLVLDLDQVERFLGDFFAHRGDGGDTFAPVAHLAVEDVLVFCERHGARLRRAVVQHARDALVREDCLHTGIRKRLRRVDALDVRVRDRAALDLRVQHVREGEVTRVERRARNLAGQVGALNARADDWHE